MPLASDGSAEESVMADKPQFVDLIRDATPQRKRTPPRKIVARPEVKEERRLSNWPPSRFARRLENLLPWKLNLRDWQVKDWF
jgi:hypothetical protein